MNLAAWAVVMLPTLTALLVLLVPGLIVTARFQWGIVARVAVSGLISVLCVGLAGLVAEALWWPFAVWQPFAVAVVLLAVLELCRTSRRRRATVPRAGWVAITATWLASAVVLGTVAFGGIVEPDQVSQNYDNLFHLSAIAHILDSGDASSLTLRTLIETDRSSAFYPSAWHSLVAVVVNVTGTSIPVAANATWLAVAVGVWIPGVAWLAQVLLRSYPAQVVALVAIPLGASFGAMPYSLLAWGSLYPTFLATAILPAAVAVPIIAARAWMAASVGERWRVAFLGVVASGGALAAIAFSQPRVLASWIVILAPAVVFTIYGLLRSGWRAGGRAKKHSVTAMLAGAIVLAITLASVFAYAVVVLRLFERPLEERLGGPQAASTQSVLAGLWQALVQSWPTGVSGVVTAPAVLLAAFVLVGIAVAVRSRGLRWVVVAYVVLAILFALAAGSDAIFSKLATGVWYKDRYRLSSVLPVLGVGLATLGILAAAAWARRRLEWFERTGSSSAIVIAWVTALTSALLLFFTGTTTSIAFAFRLPASHAESEIVSRAQIDFMNRLADIVPPDQRVLGDPWDGSAWSQVFGDREPVFPHVNGQWDSVRLQLAYNLPQIATDPGVCAALDKLRVRYVLYNPHIFGGGDPSGNHFPGPHAAVEAGLFVLVATDGETALYRIDQCGELPATG